MTPLGQVSSGTAVTIAGEQPSGGKPSPEREARMLEIAKQKGISVEALKAQRQAGGARPAKLNAGSRQSANNPDAKANNQ